MTVSRVPESVKYGRAYRAMRKAYAAVVARGEAMCSEPVCKMTTRRIAPGTPWHLSHTPDGLTVIGPSHRACNASEAASRGNAARTPRYLPL